MTQGVSKSEGLAIRGVFARISRGKNAPIHEMKMETSSDTHKNKNAKNNQKKKSLDENIQKELNSNQNQDNAAKDFHLRAEHIT